MHFHTLALSSFSQRSVGQYVSLSLLEREIESVGMCPWSSSLLHLMLGCVVGRSLTQVSSAAFLPTCVSQRPVVKPVPVA
jgi:hypothetical protein